MKLLQIGRLGLLVLMVRGVASGAPSPATGPAAVQSERRPVAVLVADWFKHSHPDVLFTRLFRTYSLDGHGPVSKLRIASVYRDRPTEQDQSARFAEEGSFRIAGSVEDALTLGTGKLAVDGVLISTEWAPYPVSDTGQFIYPHRRLFDACVRVFQASGRVVPIFIDKHLADTWQDSKAIYDTARAMHIPLMAGSSIPLCLHETPVVVDAHAPLKQIVGISYHTLTTYGFHGVEMVQSLAERRKGGETGIKQVRCLTGKDVWNAAGKEYDTELFESALRECGAKLPSGKTPADVVIDPVLFVVDHNDGLRVNLFTLNGLVAGWSAAWRYTDGIAGAALMANEAHLERIRFDWQMRGVEDMVVTGTPSWPVERTLMTSGTLDAALISKRDGGKLLPTPFLDVTYPPALDWRPPPELHDTIGHP